MYFEKVIGLRDLHCLTELHRAAELLPKVEMGCLKHPKHDPMLCIYDPKAGKNDSDFPCKRPFVSRKVVVM